MNTYLFFFFFYIILYDFGRSPFKILKLYEYSLHQSWKDKNIIQLNIFHKWEM